MSTHRLHIRILGWTIIAVSIYGLIELCAFALLHLGFGAERAATLALLTSHLDERQRTIIRAALRGESSKGELHDDLGWVMPMRSAGEHQPSSSAPPRIIAAFGDSFTYGDEVEADESWPLFLQEALPNTQVLNFGVPSYGLDQAFMRYRLEAEKLEADVVLIGFVLDDARRNTNSFRPFVNRETSVPLAKPRFVLEADELKLIPNPLRRSDYRELLRAACERDAAADGEGCNDTLPLALRLPSVQAFMLLRDRTALTHVSPKEQASRFELTARIFLEFHREARKNGSQAIVVLMPVREELGKPAFEAYKEYFVRHGITFVDTTAAMRSVKDADTLFQRWGHYSPLGNRIVAGVVREYLQQDPSRGNR